jgi:hypothetical protein
MRRSVIAPQFEIALRTTLQAPALEVLALDGERTAHDEEAHAPGHDQIRAGRFRRLVWRGAGGLRGSAVSCVKWNRCR